VREWLVLATEYAIVVIDAIALVLIVYGSLEALVGTVQLLVGTKSSHERRDVWLRYARWLVAGLTFQLAADIIESSIATGWESIGRLAAIAVIRTFLNYFLERDLAEVRERDHERAALEPRAGEPDALRKEPIR
jgi:uncharacterized membrane protein